MVTIGSGTQRKIQDIMLNRYACYLRTQNGDLSKESIAIAQNYFVRAYHNYVRGANEDLNGLIRQYIPKKSDF